MFCWCWVKILKMKFDQDLCLNSQYDFRKMNSTLGSVVPLAMFSFYDSFDESRIIHLVRFFIFIHRWQSRSLSGSVFLTQNLGIRWSGFFGPWYVRKIVMVCLQRWQYPWHGIAQLNIFLRISFFVNNWGDVKFCLRVLELPVWAMDLWYFLPADEAPKGEMNIFNASHNFLGRWAHQNRDVKRWHVLTRV